MCEQYAKKRGGGHIQWDVWSPWPLDYRSGKALIMSRDVCICVDGPTARACLHAGQHRVRQQSMTSQRCIASAEANGLGCIALYEHTEQRGSPGLSLLEVRLPPLRFHHGKPCCSAYFAAREAPSSFDRPVAGGSSRTREEEVLSRKVQARLGTGYRGWRSQGPTTTREAPPMAS